MNYVSKFGAFVFVALAMTLSGFAQQGAIPGGGTTNPGITNPGITNPGTGNVGGTNTGNVGGSDAGFGGVGDFAPVIPEIPDDRGVNGFIGRTRSAIEEIGFVGPTADTIESVSGSAASGLGGGNAGVVRPGGGALGGAAGGTNGFTITRSTIRARVRPNFAYRPVSTAVVTRNFQNRIQRLPNLRTQTPRDIKVTVEGTTATLTGTAGSQEAIDDIVGQLRMEPGVYRIVNQVDLVTAKVNPAGENPVQVGRNQ